MIDRVAGRLFLSFLAVVGVALVVASVAIGSLLVRSANDSVRPVLVGIEQPIANAVVNGLRHGRRPEDIVRGLTDQVRAIDSRVLIVATQGRRVRADTEGRLEGQVILPVPSGIPEVFTFRENDEDWYFVQRAVDNAFTLVVARPRAAFGQTVRQLLPSIGLSAAAAAVLALLIAGLLARTITHPLRDLVRGAGRFASGDLHARVTAGGPLEVRELGRAFNDMADEIERARGTERAFLADMSHELRTPLTSIQGFSQAIVDGEVQGDGVGWAARTIQREARRLIRMVEGLLQVARIEAGTPQGERERVALPDVVSAAVAAIEAQAHDAEVTIRQDIGAVPGVMGDRDRLSQLFLNVLDNAVKHSPKGATVDVGTATLDGNVVVRVRDRGAGIPTGAETRVFQRFYRGEDVERDGAGLGLAIAQAIAQAHGGHIEARNVDGGAEFTVVLPAAK
ncbi:MAG: HAMP domain-containing histidine kinase [Chloroflexota bacterium]|nr:HAMP domain-containing histidine kinase [Chloroflexota bacterium]